MDIDDVKIEAGGPEPMEAETPAVQEVKEEATPMNDEYSGEHTWRIEKFVQLGDKLYSDKFDIGTYIWRLLVFPKGNKPGWVSVFLDAPEAQYTPPHMSPKAKFTLILYNNDDPSKSYTKEASHTFTAQETDWGFTNFIQTDEFFNPKAGWIAHDGSVTIKVQIDVQKDERYAYDSRKETGFVGLKNQGATCYMNSLLQYLYNIPYFRKAVYHMPTQETDEPSKSLPLALQSLFYKLQYSKTSVSTKDLTKSFGWGTYDAFMQHDVQELNRVLCEKLEEKMKGTKVEKVINELFEGHTVNYIRCVNVNYQSERKESFMDLQLDVKGCKDIHESFLKYCEEELMDGPNQYKAEGHGLQDAKKGVKFVDLPPVLQLQLKRFEYDMHRDAMVKVNDHHVFYPELDLDQHGSKLFSPNTDPTVKNHYRLYAVLVHSGGVHGGHYYAFVRPDQAGGRWLRFDDERVTLEEERAALDEQFGSDDVPSSMFGGGPPLRYTAKQSSAYMLVYVRTSDWDRVMCDVTEENIAEHLRSRLKVEQAEKERRQKEKAEAHLYVTLRVATHNAMKEQMEKGEVVFDLVDHDKLPPEDGTYRVRKHTKFCDFKADLSKQMGVPVEKMRFWVWARRPNATYRVLRPLSREEEQLQLMDLRDHRDSHASLTKQHAILDIRLWLEVPMKSGQLDLSQGMQERRAHDDKALLFVKEYDPFNERLAFRGHFHIARSIKLAELMTPKGLLKFSTLAAADPTRQMTVVEEVKSDPLMIKELDLKTPLERQEVTDGDILILQPLLREGEASSVRFDTAEKYLDYVRQRRRVTFRRLEEPKEEGFVLELRQDSPYEEVMAALAAHLNLPEEGATRLRLTQHSVYTGGPQRHPIKFKGVARLVNMLSAGAQQTDNLYYEVLDMPLEQLEQLKAIKITWHKESGDPVSEHLVRVPRDATVGDALTEVGRQVGAAAAGKALRLLETHSSRIYKILSPTDSVADLDDNYWRLRAEVVPEGESEEALGEEGHLLHCYHFAPDKTAAAAPAAADGDDTAAPRPPAVQGPAPAHSGGAGTPTTLFGDPLLVRCNAEDTLDDVVKRVQAKLGVSDEVVAKWRFALCSLRWGTTYLAGSTGVGPLLAKALAAAGNASEPPFLGMEHEDDKPRRVPNNTYRLTYERPVKIYS